MNTVEIDWTRCDGHGLCATLLPGDIVLDEWGFPILRGREITARELPHARRAVLACPALALRLSVSAGRDRPGSGKDRPDITPVTKLD